MLLVIAGLALVVVYLAVKSPDPNQSSNAQPTPPNTNVPALGSVGNPSPAMSGGVPNISAVNRLAMAVNAGLVGGVRTSFNAKSSPVFKASAGTLQAPTQTVAELSKSLMTQNYIPTPSVTTRAGAIGSTIKI